MKTVRVSFLISTLATGMLLAESPVAVTNTQHKNGKLGMNVVALDMSKIIDQKNPVNSPVESWKDAFKSLTEKLDTEQKELVKLQAQVEQEYKQLEAKQKEGAQPTKEETTHIQELFQKLQSNQAQFQEKAQTDFLKLQEEFKRKVDTAVDVVKVKKGFTNSTAVFPRELFYGTVSAEFDITQDVVAELNSKYAAEKRAKKMATEAAPKEKQ